MATAAVFFLKLFRTTDSAALIAVISAGDAREHYGPTAEYRVTRTDATWRHVETMRTFAPSKTAKADAIEYARRLVDSINSIRRAEVASANRPA